MGIENLYNTKQNNKMKIEQEPKYEARGYQIVNRKSGKVIPDDEPIFLLRARDKHAASLIWNYLNKCKSGRHRIAIAKRYIQFDQFSMEHPMRMKEPDTE